MDLNIFDYCVSRYFYTHNFLLTFNKNYNKIIWQNLEVNNEKLLNENRAIEKVAAQIIFDSFTRVVKYPEGPKRKLAYFNKDELKALLKTSS